MSLQLTQALHRNARMYPGRTALGFETSTRDWRDTVQRISRTAAAFRSLGVSEGDRVAILSLNNDVYVEAVYAALWAGAVFVPLNCRLAPRELQRVLRDCEPRLLLVDACGEALLSGSARTGREPRVVAFSDAAPEAAPGAALHLDTLVAGENGIEDANRGDSDLACVVYTGGTTGSPKGVMLSHANLYINALTVQMTAPFAERIVHLYCGPFFHLASLARVFAVTLAGGTHHIRRRFDAREVLRDIAEHGITSLNLVPTTISRLIDHRELDRFDLSSLKDIAYGASPIPAPLLRRLMRVLPDVSLTQHYGMTETSPVLTTLSPEDHDVETHGDGRLESVGKPVVTAEVRIDGAKRAGDPGEVLVRGPMVMQGYWRQPEETARSIEDGWLRTGDVGYLDEQHYLFLVDRKKDMIISGGENVYSGEVESVLQTHDAIGECAVVGRPDPEWGEAVHAVVVVDEPEDFDTAELLAYLRQRLAGYKCPKSIEIRKRPLPRSTLGKIDKAVLRREVVAAHEAATES